MSITRKLAKLILTLLTLPLLVVVWLLKWFVMFLYCCSACEPIRLDSYTQKKMTFFFDPDGLPLELHE